MSPPRGSYGQLHQLRAEVNRLIDLLLEEPSSPAPDWQPPLDLVERDDGYELQVELPGFRTDDIQIELKGQILSIRGSKKRLATEPPGRRFHLMERFIGSFNLSLELPRPILPAESSARLEQGVLIVSMPRIVERRHRPYTIPVQEEGSSDE
jgi:HSP20 family protein